MSSMAPTSTAGTNHLMKRSMACCVGDFCSRDSSTILITLASVLSRANRLTFTSSAPSPLTVPAKTVSPLVLSTGVASPVAGNSSMAD